MPELILSDMRYGQQADGGIRDDALKSFRRLVNYDVIFGGEYPRLRVRPGFSRWNATALPGVASQLYSFADMDQNWHLLARCPDSGDYYWYEASEAGVHTQLSAYEATGRKAVVQFGNRVFLGTDGTDTDDPGMIWTSDAELSGAPYSYRLGIKKPEGEVAIGEITGHGNPTNSRDDYMYIDTSGQRKLGIKYTVGANDEVVSGILIQCRNYAQTYAGNWRVKVYTDNSGKPSATLVDLNAVSDQRAVAGFNSGSFSYELFIFATKFTLTATDTYWFVLEADTAYYDNYYLTVPVQANNFFGMIATTYPPYIHGETLMYDNVADTWNSGSGEEAIFYLGGLDPSKYYGYICTYYNSVHSIESRLSDEARYSPTSGVIPRLLYYDIIEDPQVDKVRIYRREMDALEDSEDDITDEYKYVGELEISAQYASTFLDDGNPTGRLGGYLQTQDHYCIDDTAPEDEEGRQEAIVPSCACWWKGRMWVGRDGSNQLAFSKVLEQDGATGLLGTSSPDFFPLQNEMVIPEPADPIDLYPLSNDQLIVYMSNDTIYSIFGGDQSLNPPADFAIVELSKTHGLIGMGSFTPMVSQHYYMSRDGIYSLQGAGAVKPEHESEVNDSIIATVQNQYLRNTRMITVGNEIWSLLDYDNDGDLDTIMILSLEREIPSRGLYERHWKMYQYPVGLTDLCVRNTGDEYRQIYAGDADNSYILELGTGTLGNSSAITAWLESHDLKAPNLAMIYQIEIDGYCPDESAMPTYTWELTDNAGNTKSGTMSPTGNEDVRGHRSGTRLKRPVSVRAKLTQVSTKADELRAIVLSHTGE